MQPESAILILNDYLDGSCAHSPEDNAKAIRLGISALIFYRFLKNEHYITSDCRLQGENDDGSPPYTLLAGSYGKFVLHYQPKDEDKPRSTHIVRGYGGA